MPRLVKTVKPAYVTRKQSMKYGERISFIVDGQLENVVARKDLAHWLGQHTNVQFAPFVCALGVMACSEISLYVSSTQYSIVLPVVVAILMSIAVSCVALMLYSERIERLNRAVIRTKRSATVHSWLEYPQHDPQDAWGFLNISLCGHDGEVRIQEELMSQSVLAKELHAQIVDYLDRNFFLTTALKSSRQRQEVEAQAYEQADKCVEDLMRTIEAHEEATAELHTLQAQIYLERGHKNHPSSG